tara:strand:+ start:565 stop:1161 length:597 start_codon:yes stop_codon:yes gene_type:complete
MLLLLDRRIKILFIIVSLFIFKGCGVSDSITSEYYNKTFGEREEIECPEIKIIKELGELYKENKSEELNYLVKFNSISWNCFTEYLDASSEEDSLIDELFGDEIHDNSNLFTTILLQVSFVVIVEENIKIREGENFQYVLALIDKKNNIIVKKKLDLNFNIETSMKRFVLNDKQINIRIPNKKISSENSILLVGFIKK